MRACRLPVVAGLLIVLATAVAHDEAAENAAAEVPPAAAATARVIDKAEQRRLALRTRRVEPAVARRSGRVQIDPRARWLAMSEQAVIVEAPETGFVDAGQSVRAGQVLAWLRPALSEPERRDLQAARRAEQRDFDLASIQIKRFDIDVAQQQDISLPTPSMQIIADWQGAQARGAALDRALGERVALKAPADGVLQASRARNHQIAAAGETLFEGASRDALVVEVTLGDGAAGAARLDGAPLTRLGERFDPQLRTRRVLYALDAAQAARHLAGESVEVEIADDGPAPLRLPRAALFGAPARPQVWVHETEERFVARPVRVAAIEGEQIVVDQGLAPGERVVGDASVLLRADAVASR